MDLIIQMQQDCHDSCSAILLVQELVIWVAWLSHCDMSSLRPRCIRKWMAGICLISKTTP